MKTSRFTDSQILAILKQAEAGSPVPELCWEHGISSACFYKWRSKFGGINVPPILSPIPQRRHRQLYPRLLQPNAPALHARILVTQRLCKETETSCLTLCFVASGNGGQVQYGKHFRTIRDYLGPPIIVFQGF